MLLSHAPHQAAGRLCGGCAAALPSPDALRHPGRVAAKFAHALFLDGLSSARYPGLFWLLFFSLMLPLYGLTRRLFIAYLPGTGFCMTLAIISRYKMDIDGAPLPAQ